MITQIEIGGYRILDEFKADFKPLTVVIGTNAVGKSTLIDCLQLIADCCEHPLSTVFGRHWGADPLLTSRNGNRQLTWKVTFHKPATWDVLLEPGQSLVYKVVLQVDSLGQMYPQYEVLRNREPIQGRKEPLKFLEATPYQRHILDKEQRQLIPFDEAQSSPGIVRDADSVSAPSGSGRVDAQQEPALLLSQIRFFNEFPVPSSVRVLLANIMCYPGFDVTHSSELRTMAADIKPATTLSAKGDNLGTVLHEILTRYDFRSAAEELRDFLRVAYPTFEEIHCDTTYGTLPRVLVRVREKGMSRSTEMWELSDGMLRFLCLATTLLNPRPGILVAIDEPELGLHPSLLPTVAEMIKTAAERTQVLVTTHSPDLLNCFDIADVVVMARNEDDARIAWHRPANRKTLVEMLNNITGETLGDLHRSGELEAGV